MPFTYSHVCTNFLVQLQQGTAACNPAYRPVQSTNVRILWRHNYFQRHHESKKARIFENATRQKPSLPSLVRGENQVRENSLICSSCLISGRNDSFHTMVISLLSVIVFLSIVLLVVAESQNQSSWVNVKGGSQATRKNSTRKADLKYSLPSDNINEIPLKRAAEKFRQEAATDSAAPVSVEFIADTKLPTDVGRFRLRAYRIVGKTNEFVGSEPCVIYCEDKPPFGSDGSLSQKMSIRVHDQCMTSEVFRSQR